MASDPFLVRRALPPAFRASVAVATPLVAGSLLGLPDVAQWATLGALYASIVDPGGPYRERAVAVGIAAPLMSLAIAAGATLGGARPALGVAIAALVAALGGLGRAYGEAGASSGLVVTFAYLVGLGYPVPAPEAAERGLLLLAGAAFALLLSLAPGSVRPFGPIFRVVADVFEAAARLALAAASPGERAEETIRERGAAVRRAIEAARGRLGTARAAEDGTHAASERLYVVLRAGSRFSASLAALSTAIESAAAHREFDRAVRPAVRSAAAAVARAARDLGTAIASGGGDVALAPLEAAIAAASRAVDAARDAAPFPGARYQAILDSRGVVRVLEAAAGHLRMAADVVSRLALAAPGRPEHPGLLPAARAAAARFRSQVTLGSVLFRHALRVGLAVGASLAVVKALGVPRGYWTAITVMVVLQPDFGGTRRRAIQRSLGTLAGSVAAPLLASLLPSPAAHLGTIALLALVFFLARGRRFTVSTAAVTTLILLVIDLATPIAPVVAAERFGHTIVGALVALAAGYRLWPSWEGRRNSSHVAEAVRANRAYFAAVVRHDDAGASSARRRAEVEAGNAEASYQRLLGEPAARRGDPLPRYALVTANERLRRAITSLELHRTAAPRADAALPGFEEFCGHVLEALDEIAAAQEASRPPGQLPPIEAALEAMREHVRALKEKRVAEIREGRLDTETKRAVLETAFVERELDRLVREIVDLHAVTAVLFGVRSSGDEGAGGAR